MSPVQRKGEQGNSFQLALAISILIFLFAFIAYQSYLLPQPIHAAADKFLLKPYLQLGRTGRIEDIEIAWAPSGPGKWELSSSVLPGVWLAGDEPTEDRVTIEGLPSFRLLHARLKNIKPGVRTQYRLRKDGEIVFVQEINTLPAPLERHRFVVTGDVANGGRGERAVAKKIFEASPSLVMIAGDIVYQHGRLLEYFNYFFPVYNADERVSSGVPLLRSILTVAAPGNHDTAIGSRGDTRNLDWFPDGMGYYVLWKQPLNGPSVDALGKNFPMPQGSEHRKAAFLEAAGPSFPGMNNFSFDYGNAHWLVLDANNYMDWQAPKLRAWVEADLAKAATAKWRFVIYHQAAFNSDAHHANEQQMRLLADVFERGSVDIVFAGHVHNYQRSKPFRFRVSNPLSRLPMRDGLVPGEYEIDRAFDGAKNTKPNGVIYIITGCGGASLTGKARSGRAELWHPFTEKLISTYSFTQCDMDNNNLVVQQISYNGKVLDRFQITK